MTITEKIVLAHFTINLVLLIVSWWKDKEMDIGLALFIIMMGWTIVVLSIFD